MAVTRSKRRTTGDVPHETRTVSPHVVRRGSRLGSRERMVVFMMGNLMLLMVVLLGMMQCSSEGAEASSPEPIVKSRPMESDEDQGSGQSLDKAFDDAFAELDRVVDEGIAELDRAIDEAFAELDGIFS